MKIYEVKVEKCDGNDGKITYTEREYVKTADIAAYIEAKKTAIEAIDFWWMTHREEGDRPLVTAHEIEVKEV